MPGRAGRSLADKLAVFADTLTPAERALLPKLVKDPIDPIERIVFRHERAPLLSPVEQALVDRLGQDETPKSATRHSRFLTLIVKGTRLCNLRCSYCHDWRTGRDQIMAFPTLAHVTAKALRDPTHRIVNFIWHGGETTVLPLSFYERALLLQGLLRRDGQIVRNSIQTNATRITPEWARFLHENEIGVGVSIDGPREIHDSLRRYASGRGSFDDVLAGIEVLKEYGVAYSVLMVIDAEAYALGPEAIFDFFVARGIKRFGLLAAKPTNQPNARPGTHTDHYVNPREFNSFLARLYDLWEEHGDPDVQIRELDVLRKRLLGTRHRPCTLAGHCIGSYFLIEPGGEVAHCDLFLGDPAYTLGNILTDDFATVRNAAKIRALKAANERALARLRACSNFAVCNGWCPHERYVSLRHNPHHVAECCGLSGLIDHIRTRMERESLPIGEEVRA